MWIRVLVWNLSAHFPFPKRAFSTAADQNVSGRDWIDLQPIRVTEHVHVTEKMKHELADWSGQFPGLGGEGERRKTRQWRVLAWR